MKDLGYVMINWMEGEGVKWEREVNNLLGSFLNGGADFELRG